MSVSIFGKGVFFSFFFAPPEITARVQFKPVSGEPVIREKRSFSRRLRDVGLVFITGIAILLAIAEWLNPPERCAEGGGIWHWDGRWCEAADPERPAALLE